MERAHLVVVLTVPLPGVGRELEEISDDDAVDDDGGVVVEEESGGRVDDAGGVGDEVSAVDDEDELESGDEGLVEDTTRELVCALVVGELVKIGADEGEEWDVRGVVVTDGEVMSVTEIDTTTESEVREEEGVCLVDEGESVDVRVMVESVEMVEVLDGVKLEVSEDVETLALDKDVSVGRIMVAVEETGAAEAPSCLGTSEVTALTAR